MNDKAFLDTNLLIYAIDTSPQEKRKREVARESVKEHIINENGVISIQVLKEFYQLSTKKTQRPLSTEEALEFLHYISILETVLPDYHMVVSAVHLHKDKKVSFWDAMILQSALAADCSRVLSEDLQDGFRINNMVLLNPFKK
ncbi:MAG: PIN domain-containing protein [Deltaproteobacteria bacterium]|nr:PIN domain-containing protein [Deltaproteobacteria bacterium]